MGIFTETLYELFHLPTTSRRRLRNPKRLAPTKQNPARGSVAAKVKARKSRKASLRDG